MKITALPQLSAIREAQACFILWNWPTITVSTGKSYELEAGEALFFTTGTPVEGEADICGEKYRIRERIDKFDITQLLGFATPVDLSVFVVPGLEDMVRLAKAGNALIPDKRFPSYIYYHTFFDIDGSKEAVAAFEDRAAGEIPGITRIYVRSQVRAEFYELYGSILSWGFSSLFCS